MFNLKLALRALFRTPFVTIVAILSLGLGIGANAAIFSLFNQVLLRPLPVPEPKTLVNMGAPGVKSGMTSCGDAGNCDQVFSYPMFRDLEKQQTSFTGIAAHRNLGVNLTYKNDTLRADGLLVSSSYFSVLQLTPARGRLLDSTDDRVPGQSPVAVLSYRYWQSRFGGDPNVVGEPVTVNGVPMTIVGIAPEGFDGTTIGNRPSVFVPITMVERLQPGRRGVLENRRGYWVYVFSRLKPGTTIEQATAAINQPYRQIINEVDLPLQKGRTPTWIEQFKQKVVTLEPGARGQSSTPENAFVPLLLLLGVTFVVLISACANIANLLLAKATGRTGEMAVRLSIGAARRHLIGQLLGESILLAVFGAAFGVLVAQWTLVATGSLLPDGAADFLTFQIDARMIAFLAAVTVGTGVLFGLFPALHSTRPNLATALKGQAGQPGGSRSAKWFRVGLATTQIMLSMALLAIAGLFIKSLVNVNRVDLGIRTENLVTFSIVPQMNGYPTQRSLQIFEQVENELARIPGVTHVTGAVVPVLSNDNWGTNVSVEGFKAAPDADSHSNLNMLGPDYFKTMGIQMIAGREFTRADTVGAQKVAIVNEAFAKKFGLGLQAVGMRMEQGNAGKLDLMIVGLVKDAKYSEVKATPPPQFFTPYRQDESAGNLAFYVRTNSTPDSVISAVGPIVRRIDPNLPVTELKTMVQVAQDNVFQDRFVSTLAAIFAGLATILAAVGLYGVLAYTVAQRTREIGLRMALGADATRIRSMVLRQVAWMTAVGGAIGLALAMVAGWFAKSQLYEMTGLDPFVLISSAVLLGVVALAAGFIPAYRASRVDPMLALRYE